MIQDENLMPANRIEHDRQWLLLIIVSVPVAVMMGMVFDFFLSSESLLSGLLKDKVTEHWMNIIHSFAALLAMIVVGCVMLGLIWMGVGSDRATDIRWAAEALGLTYQGKLTDAEFDRYANLPLFRPIPGESGVIRELSHVLRGTHADVPILAADYRIKITDEYKEPGMFARISSAKSHDQYMAHRVGSVTVIIFSAAEVVPPLPDFFLNPETLANKPLWKGLGKLTGWEDVNFTGTESRDRFSALYRLRGNDEETLRDFFNDERIDFFAEHPGWSVQASPEHVVVWRGKTVVQTSSLGDLCDQTSEIFALLQT
jgi:hypothetical protein